MHYLWNNSSNKWISFLFQQEPFKILVENHNERLKKIVVINGDTTIEGLGLSTFDKDRLIKDVSVTFHMAANVRFDLPLRTAINMNTRGTANVLAIVKQVICKKFRSVYFIKKIYFYL